MDTFGRSILTPSDADRKPSIAVIVTNRIRSGQLSLGGGSRFASLKDTLKTFMRVSLAVTVIAIEETSMSTAVPISRETTCKLMTMIESIVIRITPAFPVVVRGTCAV